MVDADRSTRQRALARALPVLLIAGLLSTQAAETNTTTTLAAAGGLRTGGAWTLVATLADPSGAGAHAVDHSALYGGHIGALLLRPDVVGADGVPREAATDNDGDGLADVDELRGTAHGGWAASDPDRADTDGDGMTDGDEAAAGLDPTDAAAVVKILSVQEQGSLRTVTWSGRGGGTTNVLVVAHDAATSGPWTNVLFADAVTGGAAPWFAIVTSFTGSATGPTSAYYRVKIGSP